jgi:hypothetical protein
MAALIAANPNAIALGNGKMNARGDLIGARGEVLTAEAQKYNKHNPKAVKVRQVSIKDMGDDFFESPAEAIKKLAAAPVEKQTPKTAEKKGRKLVDEE